MMIRGLIFLATMCIVVVTFLPLIRSDAGWIRMWDFPRPQLAVASLALLALLPLLRPWPVPLIVFLAIGTIGAVSYNLLRVLPYTSLAAKEVADVKTSYPTECFSVMAVNVWQHNRDARRLVRLIEKERPDVLFLVETDNWWRDALAPIVTSYETVVSVPQDNTYGLIFLTRLPTIDPVEVRYLISDAIPSVRARLRTPGGGEMTIYGLHPEPPTPFQSSEERDLELLRVAHEVKQASDSVIVMGDLNDVAWSPTTRLFRSISDLKDPRIGRGLYSTFHARVPVVRWPLDHLFHTSDLTVAELKVLPDIGSDHFPVMSRLCAGNE